MMTSTSPVDQSPRAPRRIASATSADVSSANPNKASSNRRNIPAVSTREVPGTRVDSLRADHRAGLLHGPRGNFLNVGEPAVGNSADIDRPAGRVVVSE